MADNQPSAIPMHYVCLHNKARDLIRSHDRFWVSNCGCRESRKECNRSPMNVCLSFFEGTAGSGSGRKEVSRADAEAIVRIAESKFLVARPWRTEDRSATEGICFCCDDCCGYFLDPKEVCDRGEMIEDTDPGTCNQCGVCVDFCYFKARKLDDDGQKIAIDRDRCYGCGLCIEICPENCIRMVPRS